MSAVDQRELPDWCQGAIKMAQHWVRNPEHIVEAGFPQVSRELYTISRGLAYLAASGSAGNTDKGDTA